MCSCFFRSTPWDSDLETLETERMVGVMIHQQTPIKKKTQLIPLHIFTSYPPIQYPNITCLSHLYSTWNDIVGGWATCLKNMLVKLNHHPQLLGEVRIKTAWNQEMLVYRPFFRTPKFQPHSWVPFIRPFVSPKFCFLRERRWMYTAPQAQEQRKRPMAPYATSDEVRMVGHTQRSIVLAYGGSYGATPGFSMGWAICFRTWLHSLAVTYAFLKGHDMSLPLGRQQQVAADQWIELFGQQKMECDFGNPTHPCMVYFRTFTKCR